MGCVNTKGDTDDADCIIDDGHLCCGSCFASGTVCKACLHAVPVCGIKRCRDCAEIHCPDCLHLDSGRQPTDKVCSKCLVLLSGQYMPQDLMAYSVRELRQFLYRKEVAVDHCVEKSDLIELVMLMSCSSEYLSSISEHTQHLQMLREHMQREEFPDIPTVATNFLNDNSTLETSDVNPGTEEPLANEATLELVEDKITTSEFEQKSELPNLPSRSESTEDVEGNVKISTETSHDEVEEISTVDKTELSDLMQSATENILTVDHISNVFPVRESQNKVINARNDLTQHKDGKKPGLQTCRLCSKANVDCVFLECGHMVACYTCGEQLVECPVCLNYVTRCVRAFRA